MHPRRSRATHPVEVVIPMDNQVRPRAASMAEVAERLHQRFAPELTLPAAIMVVRRCRRELEITSGPATPDRVEMLATHRCTPPIAAALRSLTN